VRNTIKTHKSVCDLANGDISGYLERPLKLISAIATHWYQRNTKQPDKRSEKRKVSGDDRTPCDGCICSMCTIMDCVQRTASRRECDRDIVFVSVWKFVTWPRFDRYTQEPSPARCCL